MMLAAICLSMAPAAASAQTATLSGIITHDGDGEALPGVTIFFPDLSKKRSWEMISASEAHTEENGAIYRFTVWQNKKKPRYI